MSQWDICLLIFSHQGASEGERVEPGACSLFCPSVLLGRSAGGWQRGEQCQPGRRNGIILTLFFLLKFCRSCLYSIQYPEIVHHHFHCIWHSMFCGVIARQNVSLNILTDRVQQRHLEFSPLFLQSFLKWPTPAVAIREAHHLPPTSVWTGILLFVYCQQGRPRLVHGRAVSR